MVALLRGVNVGGNRKVPMADLCAAAAHAGLSEVRSYIQSGNLVFDAGELAPERVAGLLENAIRKRFGFPVDVVVRTAAQWAVYSSGTPFPGAQKARPNLLHLGLSKLEPREDVVARLRERASAGEKIERAGDALWVDFVGGAGKSKLTPAVFEKAAGAPVTMRNWNTVLKLNEMLSA